MAELDRYIVGQDDAKRAVAIAIRNRWRRQQLPEELRQDVTPKNILMIGPTGVGKTEIARRLAKLIGAPFLKVEATKYTEVGYYGRDVESMVRDLVESAIGLVRQRERAKVEDEATRRASTNACSTCSLPARAATTATTARRTARQRSREKLREQLLAGELEDRKVEIVVETRATPIMVGSVGMEQMDIDLQGMFEKIMPKQTSRRELTVAEARQILLEQEMRRAASTSDKINADGDRAGREPGHHLHRRARQDRRQRQPRGRCLAAGRAARPAADRRRHARSRPATATCGPTTSCSSPPARFTRPSPAT